eukprot:CAMPEP_0115199868 /NCGR_PEP_ID=MMETSP0270-20121206/16835_1 /TAXON_ID=71861 /ORGANISM="Scrippsiella trochoidea, Strain CCMP3099" /LENGTH=173 /DNA_ID=CAMNT_0002613269 /DNA_START=119 /DNA_END=638 /DNA_ORIENTATION=-
MGARHPDPIRVPWQVVLRDPRASALRAAAVQIARHGVGVLLPLALLGGLHPLDGVALRFDADASRVLEDDHGRDRPKRQEGRDHPHRELLEPSPIGRVVLREVAIVHGVEDARGKQRPMLPVVAMVPDRLVQGYFFGEPSGSNSGGGAGGMCKYGGAPPSRITDDAMPRRLPG